MEPEDTQKYCLVLQEEKNVSSMVEQMETLLYGLMEPEKID